MNAKMKVYSILSLAVIVALFAALAFAPAAYAFDGRSDERIVIGADEVVNDDLYLAADEILIEGTVNGDVMAGGSKVTVTGKVSGDLWAAGREVIVNGELGDDLFAAATVVTLGSNASIAGDVFSAGASVESELGSTIGGTLFLGAYQGLVSGSVAEDWFAGANRLRLEGTVGGDAKLSFDTSDAPAVRSFMFGPDMPAMPDVPAGLTFGSEAEISGSLEYTSSQAVSVPASVSADVQHKLPPADQQVKQEFTAQRRHEASVLWQVFKEARRLIALLLVTALVAWLLPAFIKRPAEQLKARPWASLGVGLLGVFVIPMAFFITLGVIFLFAVLLGALTLGELVGAILGIALPALGLAVGLFFLVLGYLPQAMVAYLGGRWFFSKVHPATAEKVFWPVVLGGLVLGLLMAIPYLGPVLETVVVVAGLGAILLLVWKRFQKAPAIPAPEAALPPAAEG
jgi:cytoskeletal protein CcmA (bactofilin family)